MLEGASARTYAHERLSSLPTIVKALQYMSVSRASRALRAQHA